ncbi:MAG: type II secretion system protein GspN [Chromatiales bacterium]|jgi:hypothetical protein|nr:type II secretion system protein GspN [Chromatiales bacterium]
MWFAGGAGALYLCMLLVKAPASLAIHWLGPTGQQHLFDASGTVVNGSVRLATAGRRGPQISWNIRPWSIWRGCLGGALKLADDLRPLPDQWGTFDACPLNREFRADGVTALLRAAHFSALLNLPPRALGGSLAIDISSFAYSPGDLKITGHINWRDAQLRLNRVFDLGEVTAQMRPDTQGISVLVMGGGAGPLLDLELRLASSGAYAVTGTIDPLGDAVLTEQLALFGTLTPTGQINVRLDGRLQL